MAKLTLLLVDDDSLVVRVLVRSIGEALKVVTANGADGARDVLDRQHIDVLATDFIMETATGLALLDWCRQQHPGVGRILFSGLVGPSTTTSLIQSGRAHAVLVKPLEVKELVAVVREVAGRKSL